LELSCARRRELKLWGHVAVPELSWVLVAGAGATRHVAAPGAALCQETGAVEHAVMCVHLIFRLDLELIHGGIQSSGYRQWPPGPPRKRLRTCGWG
jgi:hypothetical protein